MAGDLEGWSEQSRLRVSDADRHRVSEMLRQAAGEGRLDIEELDERLEAAYIAKTYGDLVPLTADLPIGSQLRRPAYEQPAYEQPASDHPGSDHPGSDQAAGAPLATAHRYDTSVAIMGGISRKGVWEVGQSHTAFALMGGLEIDLREARFTSRETVIHAYGIWSGIDIYVNAHTRVIVDGFGIMGAFDQGRDKVQADLGPDSPVVRVNGFALMAGVTVQRRPMPGDGRIRRLLGR